MAQLEMDTIDLTAFAETNGYTLSKVTNFNTGSIVKTTGLGGAIIHGDPKCAEALMPIFRKNKIPIKSNDTIMLCEFYINKVRDSNMGHQYAVLHFNKENNILILDKFKPIKARIRFKVYKWTKTEIILKEITQGMPRRVYYLTKG